jgi:hypothetical protein
MSCSSARDDQILTEANAAHGESTMSRRHWDRTTRRSAGALLAMILLVVAAASHWTTAQGATVRLVIDYGDGVVKIVTGLPWSKGSTVLDVMNAARARPHGSTFSYTGSGGSSLLTQIDDIRNEGGGKKNWQLWVNATYADRSFGVYEVQAFDVVHWRYATQEGTQERK